MLPNRSIHLIVAIVALLLIAVPALAERADDTDRKSKNGVTTDTIDGIDVTIEYGRPNVNGRKIWGGLVPYGKVWRTGADEATTISFSDDVQVGDQILEAGTYALFTTPSEDEWTFILNRVAKQWGAYKYDPEQDAVRVNAKPRAVDHVEALEFAIDGSKVVVSWDKLAVGFTVRGGC